jgi:hypothetical protein
VTARRARLQGGPTAARPATSSVQAAELYLRDRYDSWQHVWWIKGELERAGMAARRRVKPGLQGEWREGAPKAARLARQLEQLLGRLLPDGEPFPGLAPQLGALATLLEQHIEVAKPMAAELAAARDGAPLRFARRLVACDALVRPGKAPTAIMLAAWAVLAGFQEPIAGELAVETRVEAWKQVRRRLVVGGTLRR